MPTYSVVADAVECEIHSPSYKLYPGWTEALFYRADTIISGARGYADYNPANHDPARGRAWTSYNANPRFAPTAGTASFVGSTAFYETLGKTFRGCYDIKVGSPVSGTSSQIAVDLPPGMSAKRAQGGIRGMELLTVGYDVTGYVEGSTIYLRFGASPGTSMAILSSRLLFNADFELA